MDFRNRAFHKVLRTAPSDPALQHTCGGKQNQLQRKTSTTYLNPPYCTYKISYPLLSVTGRRACTGLPHPCSGLQEYVSRSLHHQGFLQQPGRCTGSKSQAPIPGKLMALSALERGRRSRKCSSTVNDKAERRVTSQLSMVPLRGC